MTSPKIWALTIGSSAFMPVSCTISQLAGASLLYGIGEGDYETRGKVRSSFFVAVVPGKEGEAFRLIPLAEVPPKLCDGDITCSFLMPKPNEQFGDEPKFSYKVLEDKGSKQKIEVIYQDDMVTVLSRYRATRTTVTPIASTMNSPYMDLMFSFPFAVLVAFFVRWAGRRLTRSISVIRESTIAP